MAEKETLAMNTNEIRLATNTAASEKEKKDLLSLIRRLWEKICSLGGRGSIIQQRLEQQLEELTEEVERNEISKETLEDLANAVKEIDGKLDTITSENVEKIVDEFNKDLERILQDVDERYVEVEGKFTDKMREALLLRAKKNPELFSEEILALIKSKDFEKDFEKATIMQVAELGKNQLVVNYHGISFIAEAEFKEAAGKKTKLLVTIKDGIDTESLIKRDGELRDDVYFPKKTRPYNAETELMTTFCEDNGYRYAPDRSKTLNRVKQLSAKNKFVHEHLTVKERDGIESVIYEDSFFVRNVATNDALRVSTENGKITVTYFSNTANVTATEGEYQTIAAIESNKNGKIDIRFTSVREEVNQLMLCPDLREYFEVSGIPVAQLEKMMTSNEKVLGDVTQTSAVEEETFKEVKDPPKMASKTEEIYNKIKDMKFDSKYSVQHYTHKNKTAYIQLVNSEDNSAISFSFNKNGVPNAVNYRSGEEKSKFERVYDIQRNRNTVNYFKHARLHGESFLEMFGVMNGIMTNLDIQKGARVSEIRSLKSDPTRDDPTR